MMTWSVTQVTIRYLFLKYLLCQTIVSRDLLFLRDVALHWAIVNTETPHLPVHVPLQGDPLVLKQFVTKLGHLRTYDTAPLHSCQ